MKNRIWPMMVMIIAGLTTGSYAQTESTPFSSSQAADKETAQDSSEVRDIALCSLQAVLDEYRDQLENGCYEGAQVIGQWIPSSAAIYDGILRAQGGVDELTPDDRAIIARLKSEKRLSRH